MYKDRKLLYQALEKKLKTKVISYATVNRPGMPINGQIADDAVAKFDDILRLSNRIEDLTLIIHSSGGVIISGNNLVFKLREYCDKLHVIVPSMAMSSATIVCVGADSIMMMPNAFLGPVDPSTNNNFNPQINNAQGKQENAPLSVEAVKGFIRFAKEELKITDQNVLGNIYLKLSECIHPVAIGEVYRASMQIRNIMNKFLSQTIKDKAKLQYAVEFLCSGAGSHDYRISRGEASSMLGLNVIEPDVETEDILSKLMADANEELRFDQPVENINDLPFKGIWEASFTIATIEDANDNSSNFIVKNNLIAIKQGGNAGSPIPHEEIGNYKPSEVMIGTANPFVGWEDKRGK